METEGCSLPQPLHGRVSVSVTIQPESAGLRLDHFLVEQFPDLSRSQLSNAIKCGKVKVNGTSAKASRKLHQGDVIDGYVEGSTPQLKVEPQQIDFIVLFEDEYLLVLSKPPAVVVHPANGNPDNTLVNGLLYHCRSIGGVGDSLRPGIVHRLDKDTSGVMVVAKTGVVHRQLVDMFKSRQVKKIYHALVSGVPKCESGRIVAAIGRHPVNRKKMAVRENSGRFAATNWLVKKHYSNNSNKYALLEVVIETGRTHQIRVHLASIGHPVAGDSTYGHGKSDPMFGRQMLHSSALHFEHPVTGQKIAGVAPLWPDMQEIVCRLERAQGDRL